MYRYIVVCHWLFAGQWFSTSTPASPSTTLTTTIYNHNNIHYKLLKVLLSNHNWHPYIIWTWRQLFPEVTDLWAWAEHEHIPWSLSFISVTYKCYEMYAHREKNVQLLVFWDRSRNERHLINYRHCLRGLPNRH